METHRRREGTRARRSAGGRLPQVPWQAVRNPFAPWEVLAPEQLEAIHLTSMRILEELGMELRSAHARSLMRAAGAQVDEF